MIRTNIKNKIVALASLLGMVVFIFVAQPTLVANAQLIANAQSEEITEKIDEIKGILQKIIEIKDSDLPDDEKVELEIKLKKEVLLNIIDLGQLQTEEIQIKLESTEFPETEMWEYIKQKFSDNIKSYLEYYENKYKEIEEKDFTLDEIKTVAKEIDSYKKTVIDAGLQQINYVIITFDISDILNLADERLKKVSKDIEKIYEKELTENDKLKELYNSASGTLEEAHSLNDKTKEIILNFYTIEFEVENSSTTSTSSDKESIILERKIDFAKGIQQQYNKSKDTTIEADGGETATDEKTNENKKFVPELIIEEYIRDMTVKSLTKIKDTYGIFIEMSSLAENLLE